MITVDTSALLAIVFDEPEAEVCMTVLEGADRLLISAGTAAEVLIVAGRRNVAEEVAALLEGLGFETVSVTAASARRIAAAYQRWGKGVHPAGLNYGDCFAYDLAISHSCALLFVGDDFSQTDVQSAL
ncbi:type II toxin-antitoxin system VapC family toxin [Devosia sp. RR2S18]|uniref:type II toxin-antitoxin system VapC family toxin n=1 Tax=Devosia rhizosphaerae TaxID=3049774 RepID=UPI002541619A|nr:type II toxin-antitoxin system VapC family toxin [Devosia sp. RR2S18]WIJ25900.1 type II toxin-antitoxin system VapC family toxin [Devosia sp. RR2S18]